MSYHVTILHTQAGQVRPIDQDELVAAVDRMTGRLAVEPAAQGGPQVVEPGKGQDSEVMHFQDGALWAQNPSEPFLGLMIELANLLGARVRGDELETYRTPHDTYQHPDDRAAIAAAQAVSHKLIRKRRRANWLVPALTVGAGALVGWIYSFFK